MPKRKWNLNAIYISERLQESLRPISRCTLTTVVAPMGYGKTTAVNWFLQERAKAEDALLLRVSVYSDHLPILWKSVQDAFAHAGIPVLQDYPCPEDAAGASLLADTLCRTISGPRSCYFFLDDLHLLADSRAVRFLCTLANRLPENVHLILASRNRFLPAEEIVRLGGRLYQLGREQLRLTPAELAAYAHRCGTALSDGQLETLFHSSEGWFSAVYLNLCTFSEHGQLPGRGSDIYALFSAAMLEPLPAAEQEFLAVMGLADEFSIPMAETITGNPDTVALLSRLTQRNAFVTRLPGSGLYRFHHMMKACAEQAFSALPLARQQLFLGRYGAWYEQHGQYLHAMGFFLKSGDYDALLRVIERDAGILLSSLQPAAVVERLASCPRQTLLRHPLAVLVLMRSMFNWQRIPDMLALKAVLEEAIASDPQRPAEECGNLLGECDLIMSFLKYNDIREMSRLHRSASSRMSRPAVSIQSHGGWTFGSPSVLMMFHRTPGRLAEELAEMDSCMPHYYKITNGHGRGAEHLMRAEACLLQGRFPDALIALERARSAMAGNGQENMALCCDFLTHRLSLHTDDAPPVPLVQRRDVLLQHHNIAWLNILNSICAFDAAISGETRQIPEVFSAHQLETVHFLAPGLPMMEMIENQVYLAQGAYARVAGRSERLLALCGGLHYALVALHIRIQTASAYAMLGKRDEALTLLDEALRDGAADGFVLPFAENYRYLQPLLESCTPQEDAAFLQKVAEHGAAFEARCQQLHTQAEKPEALAVLTARELEIVRLVAAHLSNREIAGRLFLSEGSVKQYINQIYSKLLLDGEPRTKRRRLMELAGGR